MSKLNINKTEWLELVFEGKNKAYGAYQLRQEDGTTTTKAFLSALITLTGLALLPVLLSSFADKSVTIDKPEFDDPLVVTEVILPKKEEQKKIEQQIKKAEFIAPKTENLVNPNVVDAVKAPETEFTKPQDVGKPISDNPLALNGSTTGSSTGTTTEPTPKIETPKAPEGPVSMAVLEKNPMFPGGVDAFLRIVGNRFQAPEMEESNTVKIIVFFVVETDGTISNITVPRSPGYGLDKEAIRVLKSIKTKWEPGIFQGQPVRTQYSLPITVQVN
ncbi:energy transducer TonB [Flavobacterium sp. H122]|uniref:energy transducer TonB n=1 Tax=Flavobacterium sp. H122 TaxID=2529860 RepID=UPI0010A9A497|nr:energy transducer TonB [Flavobacterium sp. H122]